MKLLDRLGTWLLVAIKFVFVPRATRRRMREVSGLAPAASKGIDPSRRKALIEEAISLHRQHQDVLSELDDESREKLAMIARHMLPDPEKEQTHKGRKRKSGPEG